jgi:hypothetical protein
LRDLSRGNCYGQTRRARFYNRIMRQLPQHSSLETGGLQPRWSGAWNLRDLSRGNCYGQTRRARYYNRIMRQLPQHNSLETGKF